MTITEAADALFRIPKVQEGFIQHIERMQQHKASPAPGAPGVWNQDFRRSRSYRVVVRYAALQSVETESPTLKEALTLTLGRAGVELSQVLKDLESAAHAFQTRMVDAPEKERAEFLRQAKDCEESHRQIRRLSEFIK